MSAGGGWNVARAAACDSTSSGRFSWALGTDASQMRRYEPSKILHNVWRRGIVEAVGEGGVPQSGARTRLVTF